MHYIVCILPNYFLHSNASSLTSQTFPQCYLDLFLLRNHIPFIFNLSFVYSTFWLSLGWGSSLKMLFFFPSNYHKCLLCIDSYPQHYKAKCWRCVPLEHSTSSRLTRVFLSLYLTKGSSFHETQWTSPCFAIEDCHLTLGNFPSCTETCSTLTI